MKKTDKNISSDLPESEDDKKHLQPDEGILDLPDVKDIPGQEHIHVPPAGEMADTTISSTDEEGDDIFDDGEVMETASSVSKEEKKYLKEASRKTAGAVDEENLAKATLDDRDEEGELLNEKSDLSGGDLDIPGSEEDDADEKIGEEDEENNSYSLDNEDEDESISKE